MGVWGLAAATALAQPGVTAGAEPAFQLLRTIESVGHRGARALMFSPDSKLLLGAAGQEITIWSVDTGQPFRLLQHALDTDAIAFSSDGRLVLTAARRFGQGRFHAELKLWDAVTWKLRRTMLLESNDVNVLSFVDENTALTGGLAGLILWDLNRGTILKQTATDGAVLAMAQAPSSAVIALGTFSTYVEEWDVARWQAGRVFKGHHGEPRAVAFSPDGQMVSANANGELILWNASNAQPEFRMRNETGIWALQFAGRAQLLGAGGSPGNSGTGRIWLWATDRGKVLCTQETQGGVISALALTPDHTRFATGDASGIIRLWRVPGQKAENSKTETLKGTG